MLWAGKIRESFEIFEEYCYNTRKFKQITRMKISEFNYNLNKKFIAQFPPKIRGASKLLVLNKIEQTIYCSKYFRLPSFLNPGDCVVLNDTKVIPARLFAHDLSGKKRVEILLLKIFDARKNIWEVLIGGAKKIRNEKALYLLDETKINLVQNLYKKPILIQFPKNFKQILTKLGKTPLPPYIKRTPTEEDEKRYQTIVARKEGAVAAPTASLNFTENLIKKLKEKEIKIVYITLHTGFGTFAPVRERKIESHKMHSEWISIESECAKIINETKEAGGKIIAVGTTVARTLETVADENGFVKPFEGESDIFIYPGYNFKCVDALLTNFHAPKTTVLMLAAAFAGKDFLFKAYENAKENSFKFLSYGDSMLIK